MDSLKNIIYKALSRTGYLSVAELNEICDNNGYKRSNGERRLREMTTVIPVKNHKHYITGYRLISYQVLYEEKRLFPLERKIRMPN